MKNNNKCYECYKDGKTPSDIDCKKCDEVIIDGVNVELCQHSEYDKSRNCMICKLADFSIECVKNKICYYKRLNKALDDKNRLLDKVAEYIAENERLKAENEKYKQALEEVREILCEGRTFYDGYFDKEPLSRVDTAIKKISEVLDER